MDLSKNYVTIQGRMRTKLKLSGNELMVYAIIYGFSQTENQKFTGSVGYLAEWTGCSKRHIIRILQELCDKDLISKYEKNINGVKFIEYKSNSNAGGDDKMSSGGDDIMSPDNIELYTIEKSISNDIDYIGPKETISDDIRNYMAQNIPLPGPLPEPVESFVQDSYDRFPSIKYQINKQGSKYFMTTIKDFSKLCQEYGRETVYTVLNYIKQDEFRSKQIQSIGKLRKKNKDGVPYMVVMLEKIQNYEPKVIDLDQYK